MSSIFNHYFFIKEIEQTHKEKKKDYEQAFAAIEAENSALENEYKKLRVFLFNIFYK